ncbi:hypothetical protein MSAN_02264300 [Mycena sanguinolenta]|uniref:C2H2-type domain-containing protein n=1 Tax=Mycena sanguinolenta TaxID=230812 RepID=A0A8H6XAD1_9AGAR|nr:hypothetical protein MSAN_02264300 [Mycena sanguinolenta]
MASTSTSSRPPRTDVPVVLPSIHEMFPEHLIPRSASMSRPGATQSTSRVPRPSFPPMPPISPQVYPSFSFDVLKSDPYASSLEHIASSRPPMARRRNPPTAAAHQQAPPSSEADVDMDVDTMEESEEGEWGAEEGKKHVCPTCSKRFNRPSSLRIHVNTHTGATPFRCPHPSCGRAFNVNSNMRRHFRNHLGSSWLNSNNSSSIENNFDSPTSPSSPSFSTNPPAVLTSFPTSPYPSSPSHLSSPALSSPPSASWSASSGSASTLTSPVTPSSATSSRGNRTGSAFAPVSGWGSEKPDREARHYAYSPTGYLESDVRSDRPR